MISRRDLLGAAAGFRVAPVAGQTRRPNVLFILTDDQGWGDLRSNGNQKLDTPVLDRLRSESVSFDRFYVSPVCSPTRSCLLTGRYHARSNVLSTSGGMEMMDPEEVTIAEVLRQGGYATGCFGKWHNGCYYPSTANGQGFEEFFGFKGGFFSNYFDPVLLHNNRQVKTTGFMSDVLADAAVRFIENNRSRPFFCYLPFNHPHSPMQAQDDLFNKYTERGFTPLQAAAYAMIDRLDTNIGRVLARLDALGLAENTIVVFASDNGPMPTREAFNGGLRGAKGQVFEGGVRVPFFVRWPGQLRTRAGSTVRQIAAHVDLFPTLVEMTGLPAPKTRPLDGLSLVPLLRGKTQGWPDRMLFTMGVRRVPDGGEIPPFPGAVRTQRYNWVHEGGNEMLFDIQEDPRESVNLVDRLPAEASRLREAYVKWAHEVHPGPYRRLPIQVGHPEANPVELHAQHCYFHGSARFFGKGWENDWAVGFNTPGDYIHWNLDVVRPGSYAVAVLYASPTPSKVSVETGAAKVEAAIRKPHDPPPVQRPDRAPRWEVPEREFALLELGRLKLEKGAVQLAAHAERAVEIRAVHLKLLDA